MAISEIKPSKEQWDRVYHIIEKELLRIHREKIAVDSKSEKSNKN